ncbi:helix-turn-helix domain-containing protein [Enterococcus columbae]|nr:helix-turn-helix domain-containing protein [Enterococcus columbae]OJG21724.1 hypothetical protein RR47_GL001167 [Enterococcus columbae DSM 7374 = ATCC 51263]
MLELSEKKCLSSAEIVEKYGWNKQLFYYHMRQVPLTDSEKRSLCKFVDDQLIFLPKKEVSTYLLLIRLLKSNTTFRLFRLLLEQKAYTNHELMEYLYISNSKLRKELLYLSQWLSRFHLSIRFASYPELIGEELVMNWFRFIFCYFDAVNYDKHPSLVHATKEENQSYLASFYHLLEQQSFEIRKLNFFWFKQLVGCEVFRLNEHHYAQYQLGLSKLERNSAVRIHQREEFLTWIARVERYYYYLAVADLCRFKKNTPYERICGNLLKDSFPCFYIMEQANPELSKCFYHLLSPYIELSQSS